MGLERLGEKLDNELNKDEIIEKLNKFYGKNPSEIDPIIRKAATRSLEWNEW